MPVPLLLPLNLEDTELQLLDQALDRAYGSMAEGLPTFTHESVNLTRSYSRALIDGLRVALHALPVPSLTAHQAAVALQIAEPLEENIDYSSELWEQLEPLLETLEFIQPTHERHSECDPRGKVYHEYRERLLALVLRIQSKFPRETPSKFGPIQERDDDDLGFNNFRLVIRQSCDVVIGIIDNFKEVNSSNDDPDGMPATHGRFVCRIEVEEYGNCLPFDSPVPDEWLEFADKPAWDRHLALLEAAEPRLVSTIERWLAGPG